MTLQKRRSMNQNTHLDLRNIQLLKQPFSLLTMEKIKKKNESKLRHTQRASYQSRLYLLTGLSYSEAGKAVSTFSRLIPKVLSLGLTILPPNNPQKPYHQAKTETSHANKSPIHSRALQLRDPPVKHRLSLPNNRHEHTHTETSTL